MDINERLEIRDLIKKYQCENASQIILDNLYNDKINKAAIVRSGINIKGVNKMITDLRIALEPYKEI